MKSKLLGFLALLMVFPIMLIANIFNSQGQNFKSVSITSITSSMSDNVGMTTNAITENIAANKSVAIDDVGVITLVSAQFDPATTLQRQINSATAMIVGNTQANLQVNGKNGYAVKSGNYCYDDNLPAGDSQNDNESWMTLCKAKNSGNPGPILKCPIYAEKTITGMNIIVDTVAPVWCNKDSPRLCRNSLIAT